MLYSRVFVLFLPKTKCIIIKIITNTVNKNELIRAFIIDVYIFSS